MAQIRTRSSTFLRFLWLAGLPVLLLVVYVGMWTHATARGYQRNQLRSRIRTLSIENESLRAEMRALQSPARILAEAKAMGMEQATDVKLVTVTTPQRVAAQPGHLQ